MEAKTKVKLFSLEPYRHLFPKALVIDSTVKMGAGVSDTVAFIPEVVRKTRWQVKKYVEQELEGLSIYAACEKLWYFVKYHIEYAPDKRGKEQVRSGRRLIHDAKGDCDCFTTFINSCLSFFSGIKIFNRITAYKAGFQHIYPIVLLPDGNRIVMDCVVENFNYEEPYSKKEDYNMDLQFLDGIEDTEQKTFSGNVDAQAIFGWDEMGDLGKLKLFKGKSSAMPGKDDGTKKKGFQRIKQIAKKALNITNKINPATALLRAGILASMKTNLFKIAENLRWSYLSEDEAKKQGADMGKFAKLKNVLYKIEQIFYTAGGKPENLKKAILSGRGNKNKAVHGLGLIDPYEIEISGFDETSSMQELLGDIYHDEFVNGLEGTDGLGVIGTSAAIASATTVMGTIAALLKSIGSLFPKKAAAASGDSGGGSADEGSVTEPTVSVSSEQENTPAIPNDTSAATTDVDSGVDDTEGENTDGTTRSASADSGEASTGIKGFWEKNKKWMKPVGIGLGTAGLLYLGYRMINKNKTERSAEKSGQLALAGFSKHKHRKKRKSKHKRNHNKKTPIALM